MQIMHSEKKEEIAKNKAINFPDDKWTKDDAIATESKHSQKKVYCLW